MRILDRYISLQFFRNYWVAALGLTTLYLAQTIFSGLVDKDQEAQKWIWYCFLGAPQIFNQLTAPGVLIATVMTLSNLNRYSELTALYSMGIGLRRIASIILISVCVIALGLAFLQERILPPLHRQKTSYYWREIKKQNDFYLDIKKNKIWYRSKNLIYNLKTFDPTQQRIDGMTVYYFSPDFNLEKIVAAKEATFTNNKWSLKNGVSTAFEPNQPFPVIRKFASLDLEIQETPGDFSAIEKEVDSLKFFELLHYIRQSKENGLNTQVFETTLFQRITGLFIPFVMCIIAIPFSVRGRRKSGLAKDFTFCLLLTFVYWILHSISLALGHSGKLQPLVAAGLPTLIFGALAGFLVYRTEKNV